MSTFLEGYKKLKAMMPTFKIKISGHSIFYLGESSYEPTQELEIACNTPSLSPEDEKI